MQTKPFSFTGKGSEYFRIWIVNICLTVLTLGIYSAWATVRTRRYFYGNTRLDEENFEYHATPLQILFGRMIAITLLVVYVILSNLFPVVGGIMMLLLALVIPWVVWRSLQFNARMSSYRNVRFAFGGGLWGPYKYLLLVPLIPVGVGIAVASALYLSGLGGGSLYVAVLGAVFLGIYGIMPYVQALFGRYRINHSHYGQGNFAAELSAGAYYLIYLKFLLWGLIGVVILSILSGAYFLVVAGGNLTAFDFENNPEGVLRVLIPVAVFVFAALIVFFIFLQAFLKSRLRNYIFGKTELDDVLALRSNTGAFGLFMVYLVNLLLVIFSLGLATPWAKVRLARYMANHTHAIIPGDLGQYVTRQRSSQTSLGEEMGDAFDLDAGLGIGL